MSMLRGTRGEDGAEPPSLRANHVCERQWQMMGGGGGGGGAALDYLLCTPLLEFGVGKTYGTECFNLIEV